MSVNLYVRINGKNVVYYSKEGFRPNKSILALTDGPNMQNWNWNISNIN